jgi:hypothetical protein
MAKFRSGMRKSFTRVARPICTIDSIAPVIFCLASSIDDTCLAMAVTFVSGMIK